MKRFILIPAIALGAAASAASADVIVGSSGAAWQTFPTSLNSSSPNRPYWDNGSMDGTNMNIGDYLKGPSFPGAISPAITPNWWGTSGPATSNYDANFHFANSTSSTGIGALQLEVAGNANVNIVGWYDEANPSIKHVIWNGPDSPTSNASAVFIPSANYGFYLTGPGGTFYTDSSLNATADKNYQHFAVFANSLTPGSEEYTIGIEDLPAYTFSNEKLGDYNDFVFTVQSVSSGSPSPEPASLGLLGMGASVLLLRRRKKSI